MTLPWIIGGACVGLLAGPRIRASVFARSTEAGEPLRRACWACSSLLLPGRWRWWPTLPITGRCPACRTRIGPYLLLAECAAGLALAVLTARVTSAWELAALVWLALIAVPLALVDVAGHRLPDLLTGVAFAGTLILLSATAVAGHEPGHLARAAAGAAAFACFCLALFLVTPAGMGLGDVKLAGSVGLALCWASWQTLFVGAFAGFAMAGVYGGVQLAMHRATRVTQLPLGPFILLGALVAVSL